MRLFLKALLLLLFFVHFEISYAQLEKSNWHFGPTSKGLYFSPSGTVSVTNNSFSPYTNEGCSVVSNPLTGALLFYTDGARVIDASNSIMPNGSGLNSLPSSAGSGRLLKDPNNCNRFYLFHNTSVFEDGTSTKILYYSVIDMSLPGNGTTVNPKGDVVSSLKNISIVNNVAEGLEIVPVLNSHDYWILVPFNNSSIKVYKFSSGVITLANTYSMNSTLQDIRCVTYNSINNKIAVSSMIDYDKTLILNFNPVSGIISNEFIIPGLPAGTNGIYYGVYDLAWSPDATKLYISKYRQSTTGGKLFQYDLTNNTTQLIYNVSTNSNSFSGRGLELGPDGKIYYLYANPDATLTYIGAINNPNNPAATCGFNPTQINMGSDLGGVHKFPKFLCSNNKILNTNDTTISVIRPCGAASDNLTININKPVFDSDGGNLSYAISSVTLSGASANFTGNNAIQYTNHTSASYTDIITVKYCDDYCYSLCDSFQITLNVTNTGGSATLNLPAQLSFCSGANKILDAGSGLSSYLWSTGQTTQTINVQNSGLYYVSATNGSGCQFSDSVIVTVNSPAISLGNDTSVCGNILLDLHQPYTSVLWSNGSLGQTSQISSSGLYYVTVVDSNNCSARDSINIIVDPNPLANFSAPISTDIAHPTVKYSDESTISSPGVITKWQWNFEDLLSGPDNKSSLPDPSHTFSAPGIYCAKLIVTSNKGCRDSLSTCISIDPEFVFFIPNAFSPNGDGKNEEFFGKGESIKKFEMEIFDRWGNLIFQSDDINKHWDGRANNGSEVVQEDVYVYVIKLTDNQRGKHQYIGHITVIR